MAHGDIIREVAVYVHGSHEPIVLHETTCGLCGGPVIRDVNLPNGKAGIWPCIPCAKRIAAVCSRPVDG
jgi:hypothetical protein